MVILIKINHFNYIFIYTMLNTLSTFPMNRSGSYMSMDGEQANPQTAFSKLMAIPDDTPIKECKMLLDSMKEESLFEKNMIRNTHSQSIPLHQILHRRRSDSFHNYQKLLKYSKKKRDADDFRKKTAGKTSIAPKRSKAVTLKQFVTEKKMKMLTESSKHECDDRAIQNILKDDRARERLFDESILMERFHFVRREAQAKNQQQNCSIPMKFRGLNPKHMRMPEHCRQESTFYRRKYVHHQRTFQYFKNALQVQANLLRTKQAENSLVIRNLMSHFSQQVLASNNDQFSNTDQIVHRLFLRYANSDSEDINKMFKSISGEGMEAFLDSFSIKEYRQNQKITAIIDNQQISEFYFLQILHLLSLKQHHPFKSDLKTFLNNRILTKPHLYLPPQWQLYHKYKPFIARQMKLHRFRQKLEQLYCVSDQQQRIFSFDQMVEVMWSLKIYPFMVSKKQLRFFYLYSQCQKMGVSIGDIGDIYMYIALSKEGSPQVNIKDIIKIVANHTNTSQP